VQDLASAIAATVSLIEFKRKSSKLREKEKGKDKKDETLKKILCFLYNGPHRVLRYSKHGKLSAFVMEEERQKTEKNITSISLPIIIQTKVGEQLGGRMYAETKVGGKKLQAMVDTRAATMYMAKELADVINQLTLQKR